MWATLHPLLLKVFKAPSNQPGLKKARKASQFSKR